MATGHKYYQPNEYEQMMIAAGWITAESCDEEYQRYLRGLTLDEKEFTLSYQNWLEIRHEWDELNAQYDALPCYPITSDRSQKRKHDELLDRMNVLEIALGY